MRFFSVVFMFTPIYQRLEGNVPPSPRIEIFFLNMNTIDSLAFMFSLIYLPTPLLPCPTFISSLSNTLKRKPLIFKFKWHFGSWQCTPPTPISKKIFLSKVRFELANVPPPRIKKLFLSKVRFQLPESEKKSFIRSFELADVPTPPRIKRNFIRS